MSKVPSVASKADAAVTHKLITFTIAMILLPIGSYFASVNTVFQDRPTAAGILAAVMANVVLVGYIYVAFTEDTGDAPASTTQAQLKKKN